eukprot:PhM_4_TR3220/c0_g1_i1/m.70979/K00972/UAP1; UDP-N-acetylglucosamine/UDP-N-acetylgalactosamine diphosphorylase
MSLCALRTHLERIGQSHVLEHFEGLNAAEQTALVEQVSALPLDRLADIFKFAVATSSANEKAEVLPPPKDSVFRPAADQKRTESYRCVGGDLIRQSKCAVCILAGGQASRLGVAYPKGMVVLPDLASGLTLFQLQAQKVLRAQKLFGGTIQFLVMTSRATHDDVVGYFHRNGFLGLDEGQVHFFTQGMLPCFREDGTILMESKGRVAVAPNGNGGIYHALRDSGVLDKLKAVGTEYVQVYSVDNVLAAIADPLMYAFTHEQSLDVSAKCTPKTAPTEAVGVFALRGDRWGVIEYSEVGAERAALTDDDGELRFNAANIAVHCYRLGFLCDAANMMDRPDAPYHVARKEVKCDLASTGKAPCLKMEAFIFDVFEHAKTFGLMEVARSDEFSAVKNAEGSARDTPTTARQDLDRLHRKWLAAAGVSVEGSGYVEVSPLLSLNGEGLESLRGRTLNAPMHLSSL